MTRLILAAALLAALPATLPAQAATQAVIYSFKGGTDGDRPLDGLTLMGTKLYGTTRDGGNSVPNCGTPGCGTVFWVTPAGAEKVIHAFQGGSDGANPWWSGLVNMSGTLYGTTLGGGLHSGGTAFSVTPSGTEAVIYNFASGGGTGDGSLPYAPLVPLGGLLYGVTNEGGANGFGTVFSLTTGGTEAILHSFVCCAGDVISPQSGLTYLRGAFYGVGLGGTASAGAMYSITPAGSEAVLYSFKGYPHDAVAPLGKLLGVGPVFFGASTEGGFAGLGIVYSVTKDGKERVIYQFGTNANDGAVPNAGLINVGGVYYGTTSTGGANSRGTVYSVTPLGVETVVYSFCAQTNCTDGADPYGPLVNVGGTLYGTTSVGGANGKGAVYSINP